tara:strand:+ start:564 stop:815 length:252 start_codon:yes stop_codon:yes gene_type:complete
VIAEASFDECLIVIHSIHSNQEYNCDSQRHFREKVDEKAQDKINKITIPVAGYAERGVSVVCKGGSDVCNGGRVFGLSVLLVI